MKSELGVLPLSILLKSSERRRNSTCFLPTVRLRHKEVQPGHALWYKRFSLETPWGSCFFKVSVSRLNRPHSGVSDAEDLYLKALLRKHASLSEFNCLRACIRINDLARCHLHRFCWLQKFERSKHRYEF